jgi:hypothetical protein
VQDCAIDDVAETGPDRNWHAEVVNAVKGAVDRRRHDLKIISRTVALSFVRIESARRNRQRPDKQRALRHHSAPRPENRTDRVQTIPRRVRPRRSVNASGVENASLDRAEGVSVVRRAANRIATRSLRISLLAVDGVLEGDRDDTRLHAQQARELAQELNLGKRARSVRTRRE